MRRIVLQQPLAVGRVVEMDSDQFHYLFDVLRMQEQAEFIGLDQKGNAFVLQLGSRSSKTSTVLKAAPEPSREPDLAVTLYVPLLKGDKLDWVVQKSVELGVTEIAFFAAGRSVVKWKDNLNNKLARMEKIAREATQQCGRHIVPRVRGLLSLADAAEEAQGIFAWEQERIYTLREHLRRITPQGNLALLTGPEGGLSEEEANILKSAAWTPVSLGSRILRAETAAITLLACTMFARGEMG